MHGTTYSGHDASENSSACQKAIRRCDFPDALQRVFEALQVQTAEQQAMETHILKRLIIIASEDIGPCNPSLILAVDDLIYADNYKLDPGNQLAVAQVVQLLANSPKDRLFDWVICSFEPRDQPCEDVCKSLNYHLIQLDMHLEDRNFGAACQSAGQVFFLSEQNLKYGLKIEAFNKLKKQFRTPTIAHHYAKVDCQVWLPILTAAVERTKSQKTCNLICYLYRIACTRSGRFQFRGNSSSKLFVIHAIWAVCNPQEVEATWYADGNFRSIAPLKNEYELLKMIGEHRKAGGVQVISLDGKPLDTLINPISKIKPIPDHALDKHTKRGAEMGRGIEHFILVGSKLHYTLPERRAEQIKWLTKFIEKLQKSGDLRLDFKLPDDYFD